jgi:hypothetical protein
VFIPKWNELKSGAKVVKYFDVCNSMCLFKRKSSRNGAKRHKPYMRSAGEGKTQGKDELWKKRHMPMRKTS